MSSRSPRRFTMIHRLGRWLVPVLGLIFLLPATADAQYFGRNKVQYDDFDFRVLTTPHFDIHYYSAQREAIEDLSRMSERWYERLARLFQHEFEARKPLIFYADHPDFQQTNTIGGMVGEGTGGVTEGLKNRVVMPISSSYASTDHVLGHELVHAFQFNIAQSRRGGGMQGLMTLPLWMVEGMAEYLSLGREDPLTGMWLRDALRRDDFPTLIQLTRETRFFPYRFGQAFWTYVGAEYGDDAVIRLFRSSLRIGWQPAIQQVLGVSHDSLSVHWKAAAESHYAARMEDKTPPGEAGTLLLAPSTGAGAQNVAPSISPDGSKMVFMSEKDLFSFDLFLADAQTGEVIRKLSSAIADPHFDALRFIDSSGAWSPDGERIAFVVFANGRNEIVIVDTDRGDVQQRVRVSREIGEITGPSFSPDGTRLVFSGQSRGATDLYLVDLATEDVTALTRDKHAALQPVFSPDGNRIAFVSDRGPETDFQRLVFSDKRIALFDLTDHSIETLEIFGNVRHSNPQFTVDGRGLYFLSDPDGFSDIYRMELESGELQRVTNLATGVSGITTMSPAMSVARETGTVVFSVFDEFEFHVYSVDSRDLPAAPTVVADMDREGRMLPLGDAPAPSRVVAYLDDPETALAPEGVYAEETSRDYDRSLSLDLITQPSVSVGTDRFGNYVGGSILALFSDMLGNRNLGVAVQAQGSLKDLGGQFMYQNLESRWDWGVGAGRIPNLFVVAGLGQGEQGPEFIRQWVRLYQTQAFGLASYALNQTRRFDFAAGVNRYSYDIEEEVFVLGPGQQVIDYQRRDRDDLTPDPINLAEATAAYVGDNSFMGFTSPIRGGRFRYEIGQTMGTVGFTSLNLDHRRYFSPSTNLTIAVRGLHLGRYGSDVDDRSSEGVLRPYFLGWQSLVRGYAAHSFEQQECQMQSMLPEQSGTCPVFDRLQGNRIGVLNLEARIPLIGTDRYGLLDFGFIPTEISFFNDIGLAWDSTREPTLEFSRTSAERIPVMSTGVSARFNVLGAIIMELYYAYPWQRPGKGGHWGFQMMPGW
ncbi:MAG: peptidase S9 [Gemmatimonadales bacterium]|nr:MAG: peptidase S9 [Gemmatimonadales bacterium]